jgi:hypothetical protein
MSTKKGSAIPSAQESEAIQQHQSSSQIPFRREIGLFESFTLLASCLGTLEFGFTYTTIFFYVVMTAAFAEMIQL